MPADEIIEVPVEGGSLRVGVWGSAGPLVLASHGVTANHVEFLALAEHLGGRARLAAPDHRGRARSRAVGAPWGMRAHAADLSAILDHLGEARAEVLLGHSMGGFVAAVAAAEQPDRFGSVVLVDGGIPLVDEVPEGLTTEQFIWATIGPAMERLEMTFRSRAAYHGFWREHPAFAASWSRYVEEYVDHDLAGDAPELRPSTRREAVLGDTESLLGEELVPGALRRLAGPVRFLRAERGMLDGDPLYPEERVEAWGRAVRGFTASTVAGVNHYTIVLSDGGAARVAREVRDLLP